MRRFHNRGLFALENEDVTPPADVPADTDSELDALPDHAESVEGEVAELNNEHAEIDQADAAIDEAEDTVEALEGIRDALIEADKEGGLTRGGAQVLKVSLEHLYGRLGLPTDKVTPALESFGGSGSRQSATQVAIEDLKETAGNVWRKIVEWAKKVWDWVVKWYNKLFDTNTKLKARAEGLLKAVEAIKGDTKAKNEIDNAGLKKAVSVGEGADFKAAAGALAGFADASSKAQGHYFDGITNMLTAVEKGQVGEVPAASFSFGLSKESKVEGVEAPEGAEVFASKELPGRKRIVSVWSPKDLKASRFEVVSVGEAKEGPLPVLSKDEIKEAAEVTIKVCNVVSETKKYLGDADKAFKALVAVAEANVNARAAVSDVSEASSRTDEHEAAGRSKLDVARTAQKLLSSATTKGNAYLLDSAKAIVGWGELSAKAYSASAAGAEPKKEGGETTAPAAPAAPEGGEKKE
jgi:hypothetical protein